MSTIVAAREAAFSHKGIETSDKRRGFDRGINSYDVERYGKDGCRTRVQVLQLFTDVYQCCAMMLKKSKDLALARRVLEPLRVRVEQCENPQSPDLDRIANRVYAWWVKSLESHHDLWHELRFSWMSWFYGRVCDPHDPEFWCLEDHDDFRVANAHLHRVQVPSRVRDGDALQDVGHWDKPEGPLYTLRGPLLDKHATLKDFAPTCDCKPCQQRKTAGTKCKSTKGTSSSSRGRRAVRTSVQRDIQESLDALADPMDSLSDDESSEQHPEHDDDRDSNNTSGEDCQSVDS